MSHSSTRNGGSSTRRDRALHEGQRRITRAAEDDRDNPGAVLVEFGKTTTAGTPYTAALVLTPEEQLWLLDKLLTQRLLQFRYLRSRQEAFAASKSRDEDAWDEREAARRERREARRLDNLVLAGAASTSPTGA